MHRLVEFLIIAFSVIAPSTIAQPTAVPSVHHSTISHTIPPSKRWSNWKPPGPRDHRGPCPGLNLLANHGYINRNGTNLKPQDVADASYDVFAANKGLIAALAWMNVFTIGNEKDEFSLGNYGITNPELGMGLSTHGAEHDCSLTRLDAYVGNARAFNPRLFDEWMDLKNKMGKKETDQDVIVELLGQRHAESVATNPTYGYIYKDRFLQYAEAAFVDMFMSKNGSSPDDWLRAMFAYERLPEDWARPILPEGVVEHFAFLGVKMMDLYKRQPLPVQDVVQFPTNLVEFQCGISEAIKQFFRTDDLERKIAEKTDMGFAVCPYELLKQLRGGNAQHAKPQHQ